MRTNTVLSFERIHSSLQTIFGADLHAKRVASLAGATLGVIQSASLAVAMIGQGLALARGRTTKHAIKQVDRLLSNQGIDIDSLLHHWVPYVVGSRSDIKVAMDWTDFEADGQATIMLSLLTRHGRATPLVWQTVDTATLKNRRNGYEYQVLVRLAEVLPANVKVCIVADRGFGDQKLYRMLTEELKFDFIIRFRGNIAVAAADGEVRAAADWVGAGGRARVLRDAAVTAVGYPVKTVVCVQAKDMKEPWCLAASTTEEPARALINLYAKRWGIECAFRDTKDLRFGMGMSSVHVSTPDRRDRLWLISALAVVLLTLLGTAGEALGYDRHLKSNTTKRRTHSLFRQGAMLYELIPNMPEHLLRPLVERFAEITGGHDQFPAAVAASDGRCPRPLKPLCTNPAHRVAACTMIAGATIGISRKGLSTRRSASPVRMKSALPSHGLARDQQVRRQRRIGLQQAPDVQVVYLGNFRLAAEKGEHVIAGDLLRHTVDRQVDVLAQHRPAARHAGGSR